MYKKFSLSQLSTVSTGFFTNLQTVVAKQKYTYFKEFVTACVAQGDRRYFFEANSPFFRFQKLPEAKYRFVDEKEKIELVVSEEELAQLHTLLMDKHRVVSMQKQKTIDQQLFEEFQQWAYRTIADKPYLVYDIETTFSPTAYNKQFFEMAYALDSAHEGDKATQFYYVDDTNLHKFCDHLLAYDGRLIGYNHIWFDNPVILKNAGYSDAEVASLNQKSIDPFLFLYRLTGRRMSLNSVASSLISVGKTLASGREWTQLLKEYKETGDKKTLEKVKAYCKNDVYITHGVLLYFLKYMRLNVDESQYTFSLDDLITYGKEAQLASSTGPSRLDF